MNRVVVTGIGMITPAGIGKLKNWEKIYCLENCLSDSSIEGTYFNGLINEEYKNVLTTKQIRYMDKVSQIGLLASREAVKDSKINIEDVRGENMAIFIGTAVGGMESLSRELNESTKHGLKKISVMGMPKLLSNMIGTNLSIEFKITGGSYTFVSACASGAVAIGEAVKKIRFGEVKAALAGGSEACAIPQVLESFKRLGAVSTNNDINKASIPFSKDRSGFVLSEGAAILVLEEYEHAKKRGAKIYAEIAGYGSSSDGVSLIAPDADGIELCIKRALEDAEISEKEVEYINAHGTSTNLNDKVESKVIENVFKSKPYVSSTKSIIGHTLGAAGAIEAALCCLMIDNKKLIPTINLEEENVDEEININLLLKKENYNGGAILSNSFAFGGNNASLVFKSL